MAGVFWTVATIVIIGLFVAQCYDWWLKKNGKRGFMVGRNALTVRGLREQRRFSEKNFGPMDLEGRIHGVIDHIRKELGEVEADPTDLSEWVDIMVLAIDGAHRAGYEPEEIIGAYHAKMKKNWKRDWPDWRTVPADKAIEHVRGIHD